MRTHNPLGAACKPARPPRPLTFTPAEWRALLDDPDFLRDPDNRWGVSRRLMGLPVRIVPDHQIEFTAAARRPILARA